ncbi:MAG: hypothetical protein ACPG5B_04030 [Chitinophagales bacterium]
MEQRDIIKDQIEELGRVLRKIVAHFFDLKLQGFMQQGIEVSNEALKGKLDFEVDLFLSLSGREAKAYLEKKDITAENLETLATYLKEIGMAKIENDTLLAKTYFSKALNLLDFADEASKTMSFERFNKKAKLKAILKEII